jgi:hypothetical protein
MLSPGHVSFQIFFHNIALKGQCHEIVCELRPLVYSLGPNNMPHISFKPIKSRIKNIRRLKQGVSRCKMEGTGFHSFAKIRAPFHCGVEFRTSECSKYFISRIFSQFKYFFVRKDSDKR